MLRTRRARRVINLMYICAKTCFHKQSKSSTACLFIGNFIGCLRRHLAKKLRTTEYKRGLCRLLVVHVVANFVKYASLQRAFSRAVQMSLRYLNKPCSTLNQSFYSAGCVFPLPITGYLKPVHWLCFRVVKEFVTALFTASCGVYVRRNKYLQISRRLRSQKLNFSTRVFLLAHCKSTTRCRARG